MKQLFSHKVWDFAKGCQALSGLIIGTFEKRATSADPYQFPQCQVFRICQKPSNLGGLKGVKIQNISWGA